MPSPLYTAWFAMARSQGYAITGDYNGETPEGFGPAQYTVADGRRASTGRVFLRPVLHRPNLTVLTRAMVTKLHFERNRVVGVEYVRAGRSSIVRGMRRTVLCLGAINTPHLLMLSGIGPADHLKATGIDPVVDLPVGKNLEDHLGFSIHWTRPSPGDFHKRLRLDRVALAMVQAYLTGKGPATRIPGVILAFIKSQPALSQPDLELILQMIPGNANFWFPGIKRPYVDGYGIRTQLLSQQSRGEILLRSADPFERPRIFYNSLSAPQDIEALRSGFRKTWEMGNAPELGAFRGVSLIPGRELKSDAEIDAFIRANAIQLYHPACTCRMGSDDNAVVGPDLRVRGVEGLSIVDASVMPRLVSANPNVVIMMMAAKAATIIAGQ